MMVGNITAMLTTSWPASRPAGDGLAVTWCGRLLGV
jgi:hypothetical protein